MPPASLDQVSSAAKRFLVIHSDVRRNGAIHEIVAEPCADLDRCTASRLARLDVVLERHIDFDAWRQDQPVGQQSLVFSLKSAKRVL